MKEKIFKILHVIGYISMALLTLIFVVVGVNSCSNTEQQPNERQVLNNVIEATQQDKLFNNEEELGDYKFAGYYSMDLSYDALFGLIKMFADNYSYPGEYYFDKAYILNFYGYNNGIETALNETYVLVNDIRVNYATAVVRGYANDNQLKWEIDFSGNNYQYYSVIVCFKYGDFYSNQDFYKYFNNGSWRYLNNAWKGSFRYIIPPYLTYPSDNQNFELYFGFSYLGNAYYGVSLNNGQFAFLGVNNNLIFNKKYSLDGKQIAFYIGDTTLQNHSITLTSFGSLGFEWLESYFINQDNPIYNGTFYLNVSEIINIFRTQDLPSMYHVDYPITFYSGGAFYTNIYLDIWEFENNPNEVLVRLAYSNNGVKEEVVIYKYFNLNTLDWSSRDTDIYKETLFTITLDNSIINSENYPLLRTLYYVEYIKQESNNTGGYVGNVFVLIGDSFASILPILNIAIFPGLTIGVLIFIPLVISLVLFVVWLFKR